MKTAYRKFKLFIFLWIFLFALIINWNKVIAQETVKLEKVWETERVFKTPESVAIDLKNRVLYVSNVNENPWETDGNGFISKIDFDGNIIDENWASEGMHGPKGMGVFNNRLYVADVDAVLIIDTKTGNIVKRITANADAGLNDITISQDGTVYVSASNGNKIFKIENEKLKVFADDDFNRPNGLLAENERLLLLTSGSSKLFELDYSNSKKKILAENLGRGDGLVDIGDGYYIASDWSGRLFLVDKKYNITVLLDTRALNINTADIGFLPEKQLLFLPTFFDNRVISFKVTK